MTAGDYQFRASGYVVTFEGFTALYEEATDEKEKKETSLPPLEEGQVLKLRELTSEQKFTQPPPRYTEATLIRGLEENGIGRPSTYAPIITTIIDRGYVEREQKKLKPTLLGRTINDLMPQEFPDIVDVTFSADMEKNLDQVESGRVDWRSTIDTFTKGFDAALQKAEKDMEGKKGQGAGRGDRRGLRKCGRKMVIKTGRYGKFLPARFPRVHQHQAPGKGHRGANAPNAAAGCCSAAAPRGRCITGARATPVRFYDLGRTGAPAVRKVRGDPCSKRAAACTAPKRAAILRRRWPNEQGTILGAGLAGVRGRPVAGAARGAGGAVSKSPRCSARPTRAKILPSWCARTA